MQSWYATQSVVSNHHTMESDYEPEVEPALPPRPSLHRGHRRNGHGGLALESTLKLVMSLIFVLFIGGQAAYVSPLYRDYIQAKVATWWGSHEEMVDPSYLLLVGVAPTLTCVVLMQWLRRLRTQRGVWGVAKLLRRRPAASWLSYGELVCLAVMVAGNAVVFWYGYNKRHGHKPRVTGDPPHPSPPPEVPYAKMIGNALGFNCVFNMTLLFLPATRNSVWMEAINMSYANGIKITLVIKALGDWTDKLMVYQQQCERYATMPEVYVDGYYGASLTRVYSSYTTVVLVGGGVGVTPLLGVLEDICAAAEARQIQGRSPLSRYVITVFVMRELELFGNGALIDGLEEAVWITQLLAKASTLVAAGISVYCGIMIMQWIRRGRVTTKSLNSLYDLDKLRLEESLLPPTKEDGVYTGIATYRELLSYLQVTVGRRPDLAAHLREAHTSHYQRRANGETPIGVLASGPENLKAAIAKAAALISAGDFDIHEEEFEL
ncbi:unnamed protein product [Phytophthora fragariaefolia]|uniref:Unnamed protein product n=1 Tax=Phytophthora fragariaefolia TaxID=1490495 RepID=A0A9W6XVH1_9STRA|nr:unnamed protein product [Phytophthora fragariaefolia]